MLLYMQNRRSSKLFWWKSIRHSQSRWGKQQHSA